MAVFQYIGFHQPRPGGDYELVVPTNSGRATIIHSRGVNFNTSDDEVTIASLEYHVDPWSLEYDFVRIS